MTAEKEKRDKEFREWKEALNKRCDEHLKNNPERPRNRPLYAKKFLPSGPVESDKIRVTVIPHANIAGAWCVWRDGFKVNTFFGIHAQTDATKFAADMLNDGDLNV